MSNFQRPPVAPYFAANAWNVTDTKDLRKELQKAIVQDPEIQHKADVSVDVRTDRAKVTEIHLIGSAGSDREKERAEQVVAVNTRDEVKIVNELVLK